MHNGRTVVMIHPGGLGDVLLAVPAMIRLRTRFPNHRLVLCADDQISSLLFACRIIDVWTSVHGRACTDLFAGRGSVTGQVQTWLKDCDLAIGWMQDLGGGITETLKKAGAQEVIVMSPFSTALRSTHQCDRFLETIKEVPIDGGGEVQLTVTESIRCLGQACLEEVGLETGQPFVVVHPGSGSAHKCVESGVLANLIVALQNAGVIPMVLEGPTDREPVERLLRLCVNPPIILKSLNLLSLPGILAHAHLFVGNDSGITQMAGLMGVRTIAIFGPTDPTRWAARGPHVNVLRGAPCQCQSWKEINQCEEKSCLKVPQNNLVTLCLAYLKDKTSSQKIPSARLVTDQHVC